MITLEILIEEIRKAYLAGHKAGTAECTCTFAQRAVGDGCQRCNPELSAEYYAEGERS